MQFFTLSDIVRRHPAPSRRQRRAAPAAPAAKRRFAPALGLLEDRVLLSFPPAIVVSNANDSGLGSLRAAITTANSTAGDDAIVFAPSMAGKTITLTSGPLVINPSTAADGLVIDAKTQPSSYPPGTGPQGQGALQNITIDGLNNAPAPGQVAGTGPGGIFLIQPNSGDVLIAGLTLVNGNKTLNP